MKPVIKNRTKETPFQLFFLENNATQNIETIEVDEIDFKEVKRRLENGESVFITKKEHKPNANFIAYEQVKEPWYIRRS